MQNSKFTEAEAHGLITGLVATWAKRRVKDGKKILSQGDLADAAGIHAMTLSRYERLARTGNLRCIPLNHFVRVEAALAAAGMGMKETAGLVSAFKAFKKTLSPRPLNT